LNWERESRVGRVILRRKDGVDNKRRIPNGFGLGTRGKLGIQAVGKLPRGAIRGSKPNSPKAPSHCPEAAPQMVEDRSATMMLGASDVFVFCEAAEAEASARW
jgi:hypothetical protein